MKFGLWFMLLNIASCSALHAKESRKESATETKEADSLATIATWTVAGAVAGALGATVLPAAVGYVAGVGAAGPLASGAFAAAQSATATIAAGTNMAALQSFVMTGPTAASALYGTSSGGVIGAAASSTYVFERATSGFDTAKGTAAAAAQASADVVKKARAAWASTSSADVLAKKAKSALMSRLF